MTPTRRRLLDLWREHRLPPEEAEGISDSLIYLNLSVHVGRRVPHGHPTRAKLESIRKELGLI